MLKLSRFIIKSLENNILKTQTRYLSSFQRQPTLYLTENQRDALRYAEESETDWDKTREFLKSTNRNINDVNIHGLILNFYASAGYIQPARSYIKSLESQGNQSFLLVKSILLRTFHTAVMMNGYKITDEDQEMIIRIYKEIKEKYDVLDSQTCENLIFGLSLTNQWRSCLKLLEESKLTCKPPRNAYGSVILAAFENSDPDEAKKLINEIIKSKQNPSAFCYSYWFKWCLQQSSPKNEFEELFECLQSHELLISRTVAEQLQASLSTINATVKEAHISSNGTCATCRKNLSHISLTDDEFKMLRDEFLNRVLIRSDIYLKTNPQELNNFKRFLEKNGPYGCVVDGLNIAYSSGNKNSNPRAFASLLAHVVTYLSRTNKRILVLGRKHMSSWPRDQMDRITSRADTFYTENLTQDDPYLLYAALFSGPNTHFCSRDMMRSHAFLLGDQLKPIFHKWRQHHQYSLIYANRNSSQVIVQNPIPFKVRAHKVDDTWHLPFVEQDFISLDQWINEELQWLCINLKASNKN